MIIATLATPPDCIGTPAQKANTMEKILLIHRFLI